MNISVEILDKVKRYVNGELSEDERNVFEQMLKNQPELQEEVAFANSLVGTTEIVERERILKLIQEVDSESKDSIVETASKTKTIWKQKRFWIIAVIVLTSIAAYFLWVSQNQPSNDYIAFRNGAYKKPLISDSFRGYNSGDVLYNAGTEYKMENFQQSLIFLENISNQDSLYLFSLLLKGHNLFKQEKYEQAILAFDEILIVQAPNYKKPNLDNAGWTKILCFLAQWQKSKEESEKIQLEQALEGFIQKSVKGDAYYEEALKLKEML